MGSRKAALAESASFWPLDTPSGAHAGHAGVAKATTGAVVRTLDDLVSEVDLKSIDFVKLDIDGYEVEVLRGTRDTVRRFAPVIFFEHSPMALPRRVTTPTKSARYSPRQATASSTSRGAACLPAVKNCRKSDGTLCTSDGLAGGAVSGRASDIRTPGVCDVPRAADKFGATKNARATKPHKASRVIFWMRPRPRLGQGTGAGAP